MTNELPEEIYAHAQDKLTGVWVSYKYCFSSGMEYQALNQPTKYIRADIHEAEIEKLKTHIRGITQGY